MKRAVKLLVCLFVFFSAANYCLAGFGISPPYVSSDKLMPGSHYEQQITLVRSEEDAKSEGRINVNIEAPEIASWITIDKGTSFAFPAGEKFIYMNVRIDVPIGAPLKQYKGSISANLSQPKGAVVGGSSVALGAIIDINLLVGDQAISDFNIYSLTIPRVRKNFPILVWLGIDNKGNASVAPQKVVADIYDVSGTNLLMSLEGIPSQKVGSFSRGLISIPVEHTLEMGSYWADLKIYNNSQVVRQERVIFSVIEPLQTATAKGGNTLETNYWKIFIRDFNFTSYLALALYALVALELILIIAKLFFSKPVKRKSKGVWPEK